MEKGISIRVKINQVGSNSLLGSVIQSLIAQGMDPVQKIHKVEFLIGNVLKGIDLMQEYHALRMTLNEPIVCIYMNDWPD